MRPLALHVAIGAAFCMCLPPGTAHSRDAAQQTASERSQWNRPVEPFRIVGNVYYVGAAGVSAFLVATPAGSILLDGGLPETAAQIARNIAALGFKIEDVRFLLNSHAHFDHAGGLAELKRLSRATTVGSARDAEALRAGSRDMPAVAIDRTIADGETIGIGDARMTAHLTPGHTKGCTTWTTTIAADGRPLTVVFAGSTGVNPGTVLPSMPTYPNIGADYQRAFEVQASLQPDIWLAAHAGQFGLAGKRERQKAGGPNPFIDPDGWRRSVSERRAAHAELLARPR